MMYYPEFRYRVGLKDYGDNKIKLVASALEEYGKVRDGVGSKDANLAALRNLSKACVWWLFDKQKKLDADTSPKTASRAAVIRPLLQEALAELSQLSPEEGLYASRKCQAIGAGMVVTDKKQGRIGPVTKVSFFCQGGQYEITCPGLSSGSSGRRRPSSITPPSVAAIP